MSVYHWIFSILCLIFCGMHVTLYFPYLSRIFLYTLYELASVNAALLAKFRLFVIHCLGIRRASYPDAFSPSTLFSFFLRPLHFLHAVVGPSRPQRTNAHHLLLNDIHFRLQFHEFYSISWYRRRSDKGRAWLQ